MRKHTQLILIIFIPIMISCSGRGFSPIGLTNISSSCPSEKMNSPFKSQKIHVSQTWFKGIRKATTTSNQLVITFDVQCMDSSEKSVRFIGHKINLSKIPHGMKRYSMSFEFPSTVSENSILQAAEGNPCILGITEQMKVRQFQAAATTTVSDPKVSEQTYLEFLNFDQSLSMRSATTQKIRVAVIDTGVNYNHADLSTQMWSNSRGETGYNFIAGNAFPLDDDGHGTHVAGIIGAANNNNAGIAGIAGDHVEIMAVKVLDAQGGGTAEGVYNGIAFAIANGAEIINLSIESLGKNPLLEQGIFEAVEAGVLVTMAAGNAETLIDANNLYAPAYIGPFYSGAISVASVDTNTEALSSFSNYSSQYIEMAAPGSFDTASGLGILSTYRSDYSRIMGTSQATPMITAGAVLLMAYLKSQNVSYTPASIENWLRSFGKRSLASLSDFVNGGTVLDLGALSQFTLSQIPVNSEGGAPRVLPNDDSASNSLQPTSLQCP